MKKVLSFVFHRVVIVALLILLQLGLLIGVMVRFEKYFSYFYLVCTIFALVMVLEIVSDPQPPAYKIAWIIVILLAPVFGGLFYAVFGGHRLSARTRRRMQPIEERVTAALADSGQGCAELETVDPAAAGPIALYPRLCRLSGFSEHAGGLLPSGGRRFPRHAGGAARRAALHLYGILHRRARRDVGRHPGGAAGKGSRRGGGALSLRRPGQHHDRARRLRPHPAADGHPGSQVQPVHPGGQLPLQQPGPPQNLRGGRPHRLYRAASSWRTNTSTASSSTATGKTPSCACGGMRSTA